MSSSPAPGVDLPLTSAGVGRVVQHMADYHTGWNATTSAAVEAAYPILRYGTQANRLTKMGTHFCFACGTRNAVRALAAQGVDTFLYHYDYHGPKYKNPASLGCAKRDAARCSHCAAPTPRSRRLGQRWSCACSWPSWGRSRRRAWR